MKSLDIYLPKDVSNIILDYLYKPDIKKLNGEYNGTVFKKKCSCSDFCEWIDIIQPQSYTRSMNHRHHQYSQYYIGTISRKEIFLPKRYKYSSGMNYPKGFCTLYC